MKTKDEQSRCFDLDESGRRIRKMREQRGMTIRELAEKSGVSDSMIKSIEYGEKAGSIYTYNNLCGALNSSLSYIAEDDRYVDILLRSDHTDHTSPDGLALYDNNSIIYDDKDEKAYKRDVARMIDIMGHLTAHQRAYLVEIAESYDEGVKAPGTEKDE